MEVHSHTHTSPDNHRGSSKKKWTHYLWEFLMLFLAVFCGFLAENKREHMVEHQREKKYMRSLIEDLSIDTLKMHVALTTADSVALFSDSVVVFLRDNRPQNSVPKKIVEMTGKAGRRQDLVNTDRTSSQLKNSGAMRLIRNDQVSSAIMQYWNQLNQATISIDRYMIYRNSSRDLVFKLWLIPEVIEAGGNKTDTSSSLRLIDKSPERWDELANLLAMCGTLTRGPIKRNLEKQLELARELIELIKDKYHLK